jgi:hypothetical protein
VRAVDQSRHRTIFRACYPTFFVSNFKRILIGQ